MKDVNGESCSLKDNSSTWLESYRQYVVAL